MRPRKGPPLFVGEHHHDVLPVILGALRRAGLPRAATLVHLDSHPDLAPPPASMVGALARGDDAAAHRLADIASWVLPLVLLPLAAEGGGRPRTTIAVDRVVWVAAPWSRQMDTGTYRLRAGVWRGRVRVTPDGADGAAGCADYFAGAGCWMARPPPGASLWGAPWTLTVTQDVPGAVTGPWLLDVDLDWFVCDNPQAVRLRAACGLDHRALAAVAAVANPSRDWVGHQRALRRALARPTHRNVAALRRRAPHLPLARLDAFRRDLVPRLRRGLPLPALMEALAGLGLPQSPTGRRSSWERDARVAAVGALARGGRTQPLCVTVARSVADGFTPPAAATEVLRRLLRALRSPA